MKKHPEIQKQHRLSQVYLKKFGFQIDGEWMVSIMELGNRKIQNVKVSEFTAEENIFDLPFTNFDHKRHFETLSGKLENDYNRLVNNIEYQKALTEKDKDLLNNFIANILCRTTYFRSYIKGLIDDVDTRIFFLKEIMMFKNDGGDTEYLLNILKSEIHLNLVIGPLMDHMVHILSHFKKVILKSPKGYGWLTTDNPVYIDNKQKHEWILPIEAELYFPISREYCVFLFHKDSKLNSNPLRNLKLDKVNQIDFELFDKLIYNITRNLDKYLIFSENMG